MKKQLGRLFSLGLAALLLLGLFAIPMAAAEPYDTLVVEAGAILEHFEIDGYWEGDITGTVPQKITVKTSFVSGFTVVSGKTRIVFTLTNSDGTTTTISAGQSEGIRAWLPSEDTNSLPSPTWDSIEGSEFQTPFTIPVADVPAGTIFTVTQVKGDWKGVNIGALPVDIRTTGVITMVPKPTVSVPNAVYFTIDNGDSTKSTVIGTVPSDVLAGITYGSVSSVADLDASVWGLLTLDSAGTYAVLQDNYSFANTHNSFGYSSGYQIPIERYEQLFSASDAKTYRGFDGTAWGGSCFGFSTTDLGFFEGVDTIETYVSGAQNTNIYAVPAPGSPTHALTKLIELYQISQRLTSVTNKLHDSANIISRNGGNSVANMKNLIAAVESFQKWGTGGVVLGVMRRQYGGHAVTPYAVEAITDAAYTHRISIYDNNWPEDASRYMYVNENTGGWTYVLWSGMVFGSEQLSGFNTYKDYCSFVPMREVESAVQAARKRHDTGVNMTIITAAAPEEVFNSAGQDVYEAGGYEIVPMALRQGAPTLPEFMYRVPDEPFSVASDSATFMNGDASFTVTAGGAGAVISAYTGANAYVNVAGGTGSFSIALGTNTTADNPLQVAGTAGGAITAYRQGDGLVLEGGGSFTATNGTKTEAFTLPQGASMSLSYDLSYSVSTPSGDNDDFPAYASRTLTDSSTGVRVGGRMAGTARLNVKGGAAVLHAAGTCAACSEIRARQAAGEALALYDISLTVGHAGKVDVYIPFSGVAGQTYTVLHCNNGTLEQQSVPYANGGVTTTWGKLSPFAVVKGTDVAMPEDVVIDPPKTGDADAPAGLALLGFGALAAAGVARRRRAAEK